PSGRLVDDRIQSRTKQLVRRDDPRGAGADNRNACAEQWSRHDRNGLRVGEDGRVVVQVVDHWPGLEILNVRIPQLQAGTIQVWDEGHRRIIGATGGARKVECLYG